MRVPSSAPADVQQAFREVWQKLDESQGSRVWDLHGRRIVNAGRAIDPFDYATLDDVKRHMDAGAQSNDGTFQNLTVRGRARFNGPVLLPDLVAQGEGGVVYIDDGGRLNAKPLNLYWNNSQKRLRLGLTPAGGGGGILSWHNRARITSPDDGILLLTNDAADSYDRVQFGGTSTSFPALKRNGAGLEAKLADDSGFTTIKASQFLWSASQSYNETNVSTDRAFDANATTIDELADVLGTLIGDLRNAGLIA